MWKIEIKQYCERKSRYVENKKALFTIIWVQFSTDMKTKLKALDEWDKIDDHQDALRLLKEVKGVTFQFETHDYISKSLVQMMQKYYTTRQDKSEPTAE